MPGKSTLRREGVDSSRANPFKSTTAAKLARDRDLRWWRPVPGENEKDPTTFKTHQRVMPLVARIRRRTSSRRQMDLYHACLYDDADIGGLGPGGYDSTTFDPSTLSFNVVRQNVDTLTAQIAKERPLPMPLTSGGNWQQQRRARKYGRFIEGSFEATGVWRMAPQVARDAALFGTGISHNYRVGKKIMHDRIFPWELCIDPREAMYGKPRTVYLRRWVDRLVLAERFPDFADLIEQAQSTAGGEDDWDMGFDSTSDLVLVIESWHLRSGEEASDGAHAICISNATLLREEYSRDYFPFSVLRMSDPLVGWFGTGLGKMLTGIQFTINDTSMKVQEHHAMAGGYILVPDGSDLETGHLDNGVGTVLRHTPGMPPTWINPQPVHPDQWNFVMALLPWANNMSGVSQLSAQGQKPSGITAARALEALSDEQSGRFALFSKNHEDYFIDIAWQQFDLQDEIVQEGGNVSVKAVSRVNGRRQLDALDFKELRLDRDSFMLMVFPTSMLPKTPAGRIQIVQNLADAGWLSADEAKMLLDFPDFERTQNLAQAAYNLVQKLIERMLDATDTESPEAYTYPEPFMNLDLCISATQQAYLDAKIEGADEKNLKLLSQFIQDARAEKLKAKQADLDEAKAAAPAPVAAPVTLPEGPLPGMPPVPPGAPMPPPGQPAGMPMAA